MSLPVRSPCLRDTWQRAALLLLLQRYMRQFGQLSWTGGGFSLPGVLREALVAFTEACKQHRDDSKVRTAHHTLLLTLISPLLVLALPPKAKHGDACRW